MSSIAVLEISSPGETINYPLFAAQEVLEPILRGGIAAEQIMAAKCFGLMAGYHERWKNAAYQILYVERVVDSLLYNPATKRSSRSFHVAGKIDVGAIEIGTGREVILDHKTSSIDISDPNSPFWRQLVIEGQASHYMLIEWLNGRKIDYAIWDVVRKPSISPKQIAAKDLIAIVATQKYFEQSVSNEDVAEVDETKRETPAMYAARLAFDCTQERPQWYFQRRSIPRLDAELLEYAGELWDHSQDILEARRNGRNPRNSGACMLYGSPCKFLGICSGHDSIDSDHWARREWTHPELPVLDVTTKEVLTNSRIRTWQTCRRKEYLQYEIGLERIDEEEREALLFGSMLHEVWEAYFTTLKTQQQKETAN